MLGRGGAEEQLEASKKEKRGKKKVLACAEPHALAALARSLINHVYSRDGCKTIYGSSTPDGEQPSSGDGAGFSAPRLQEGGALKYGQRKKTQTSARATQVQP